MFPEFKKKISSFLSKEDGRITKEGIIKAGLIVSAAGFAASSAEGIMECTSRMNQHANTEECFEPEIPENRCKGNINQCDQVTNTLHLNDLGFTGDGNGKFEASHDHCAGHNQHCSHGSHGSHGSHCKMGCI